MNDRLEVVSRILSGTDPDKMLIRQALHSATLIIAMEAELTMEEGGDSGVQFKTECTCGHLPAFHDDESEDHECDILECDCEKFVANVKEKK